MSVSISCAIICLIYSLYFLLCFWEQRVGGKVFTELLSECRRQQLTKWILWNAIQNQLRWSLNFFLKSNSVHYYALPMALWEKSVVWKHLYKIIYWGVQENIVILNVKIFCIQTKVFGSIKFCCPIITFFHELNSNIFSLVLQ